MSRIESGDPEVDQSSRSFKSRISDPARPDIKRENPLTCTSQFGSHILGRYSGLFRSASHELSGDRLRILIPCASRSKFRFELCEASFDPCSRRIVEPGEQIRDRSAEYDLVADGDLKRRRRVEPFVACDGSFIPISNRTPEFGLAQARGSPVYAEVVGETTIQFIVRHSCSNFCVRPFMSE